MKTPGKESANRNTADRYTDSLSHLENCLWCCTVVSISYDARRRCLWCKHLCDCFRNRTGTIKLTGADRGSYLFAVCGPIPFYPFGSRCRHRGTQIKTARDQDDQNQHCRKTQWELGAVSFLRCT